jgi:hypothetical protein
VTLRTIEPWIGLLRFAGVGLLFLLVYMLVLRPITRRVMATIKAPTSDNLALPAAGGRAASKTPITAASLESELERELSESGSEVTRAVALKRHLVDKVRKEPDGATRLIQSWTRERADEQS